MEKGEIENYLLKEEIFRLFRDQLKKDFEGAGIDSGATARMVDAATVRPVLRDIVQDLQRRSDALSRLLYRVDVSEAQLRSYTAKMPGAEFVDVVAGLIIMRTLQKVVIRKKLSDG